MQYQRLGFNSPETKNPKLSSGFFKLEKSITLMRTLIYVTEAGSSLLV